jgi:hypothetical protein
MTRAPAILIALLAWHGAHAAAPLDTLMTGTVKDAVTFSTQGSTTNYCLLNVSLPPGAAAFADNGPSVSFYQRDTATSDITIAFPQLGNGTQVTGQNPVWNFYAAGTAQLVFSSATAGSIGFLPGGIWVPDNGLVPTFSSFSSSWNVSDGELAISFVITLGNCSVPFSAVYAD